MTDLLLMTIAAIASVVALVYTFIKVAYRDSKPVPRIQLGDQVDLVQGDEVLARLRLTHVDVRIEHGLPSLVRAELTDTSSERWDS